MEKRILYGLVVMLMHLVGSGFSQGDVQSEEAEWERFLMEARQPVVVTLTSSLCGVPCAILEDQVAQLAETYGNHIIFYKADILEKPFLARLYKVLIVPTVIAFKSGEEIDRLVVGDESFGSISDFLEAVESVESTRALSDSSSPRSPPSGA